MQILPFKEPSNWNQQITLGDRSFFLEFTWNALNEFWTMDIYDIEKDPIIYGIKLVSNYPLLSPYITTRKPKGEIICQNIVEGESIIKRFDMSQKFELIYYTEQEIIDFNLNL